MTKKLWLCVWAVAVLMLAGLRPAMATLADDATFDISVGTPPANPNPVFVGASTTVSFNVELYKDAQGQEDPNVGASSQSYTINVGYGIITSVSDGFTIAPNAQTATKTVSGNNSSPSSSVSVTVAYSTIGIKTVSLSGSISYTDNSSDSDSASVSLVVKESDANVEIQLNDTASTSDDLTRLGTNVSGRIKALSGASSDLSITLTNPDGRLTFSKDSITGSTLSLSVPKNGDWVGFSVGGQVVSESASDAVIEAHKGSATGEIKGTKSLSIWQLVNPSIVAVPGGQYEIRDGSYYLPQSGTSAIDIVAKVFLKPEGVNANVPQISKYKFGIQQNVEAGGSAEYVFDASSAHWAYSPQGGAIVGKQYQFPTRLTLPYSGFATRTNDTDIGVEPWFEEPKSLHAGENVVSREDTPGQDPMSSAGGTAEFDDPDSGKIAATIVYSKLVSANINRDFSSWAVLSDTTNYGLLNRQNLAQAAWAVDVYSSSALPQMATGGFGFSVLNSPVDSPISNKSFNMGTPTYSDIKPFTCR